MSWTWLERASWIAAIVAIPVTVYLAIRSDEQKPVPINSSPAQSHPLPVAATKPLTPVQEQDLPKLKNRPPYSFSVERRDSTGKIYAIEGMSIYSCPTELVEDPVAAYWRAVSYTMPHEERDKVLRTYFRHAECLGDYRSALVLAPEFIVTESRSSAYKQIVELALRNGHYGIAQRAAEYVETTQDKDAVSQMMKQARQIGLDLQVER